MVSPPKTAKMRSPQKTIKMKKPPKTKKIKRRAIKVTYLSSCLWYIVNDLVFIFKNTL